MDSTIHSSSSVSLIRMHSTSLLGWLLKLYIHITQIRGTDYDERSADVYAFGLVLYGMFILRRNHYTTTDISQLPVAYSGNQDLKGPKSKDPRLRPGRAGSFF
jgi:hypothetical protein